MCSLSFRFPTKILYAFLTNNLVFLDVIILMFYEGNELWNSSLCAFLQNPVTHFLARPAILSTVFSDVLIHVLSFPCESRHVSCRAAHRGSYSSTRNSYFNNACFTV
jgi:hypothetical protein